MQYASFILVDFGLNIRHVLFRKPRAVFRKLEAKINIFLNYLCLRFKEDVRNNQTFLRNDLAAPATQMMKTNYRANVLKTV